MHEFYNWISIKEALGKFISMIEQVSIKGLNNKQHEDAMCINWSLLFEAYRMYGDIGLSRYFVILGNCLFAVWQCSTVHMALGCMSVHLDWHVFPIRCRIWKASFRTIYNALHHTAHQNTPPKRHFHMARYIRHVMYKKLIDSCTWSFGH